MSFGDFVLFIVFCLRRVIGRIVVVGWGGYLFICVFFVLNMVFLFGTFLLFIVVIRFLFIFSMFVKVFLF